MMILDDEFQIMDNLVKWAKQGVLMLKTVLTVRATSGKFAPGIGWEELQMQRFGY